MAIAELSEQALILAPLGRDADVAARMLGEAGIASRICADLPAMRAELDAGAGFAVLTEEALATGDMRGVSAWIADQPEWSDFPFVLLTHRGGGLERNPSASRHRRTLGNVTFVERPFHPTTLVSLAEAALRGENTQVLVDLAHTFDMRALAEGVESERAADLLRQLGCDLAQGYHYSQPLPAKEFLTWFRDRGDRSLPIEDAEHERRLQSTRVGAMFDDGEAEDEDDAERERNDLAGPDGPRKVSAMRRNAARTAKSTA